MYTEAKCVHLSDQRKILMLCGKESVVVGCVFVCCMYMGILVSTPMCTREDQEKLLKVFL